MNVLDVFVVVVMAVCLFAGFKKGLVKSVFDLFSIVIALFLANRFYPVAGKYLRQTGGLYEWLKSKVANGMGFSGAAGEQTIKAQTTLINSLPVPDFFSKLLLDNNNDELYRMFDVSTVEDYIACFVSSLFINGIALVLVFVVTLTAMKIISGCLNLFTELPVIKQLNRMGGVICGLFSGTLLIWFLFTIVFFFCVQPPFLQIQEMLAGSRIAIVFYENNLLLDMISKINI